MPSTSMLGMLLSCRATESGYWLFLLVVASVLPTCRVQQSIKKTAKSQPCRHASTAEAAQLSFAACEMPCSCFSAQQETAASQLHSTDQPASW